MHKNIIYSLSCPNTGQTVYVGKSTKGLVRPYSHRFSSHSKDLMKWLKSIDTEPVVSILQFTNDENELNELERIWIGKMVNRNQPLFNKIIPTQTQLRYHDYSVGCFIKEKRKEIKLTQVELSQKAGVGLRFIRELEQGKETLKMDKILQVLSMFGATLTPVVK